MTDGPGLNARHRLRKQPCCVSHPLKASNFASEAFSFPDAHHVHGRSLSSNARARCSSSAELLGAALLRLQPTSLPPQQHAFNLSAGQPQPRPGQAAGGAASFGHSTLMIDAVVISPLRRVPLIAM